MLRPGVSCVFTAARTARGAEPVAGVEAIVREDLRVTAIVHTRNAAIGSPPPKARAGVPRSLMLRPAVFGPFATSPTPKECRQELVPPPLQRAMAALQVW